MAWLEKFQYPITPVNTSRLHTRTEFNERDKFLLGILSHYPSHFWFLPCIGRGRGSDILIRANARSTSQGELALAVDRISFPTFGVCGHWNFFCKKHLIWPGSLQFQHLRGGWELRMANGWGLSLCGVGAGRRNCTTLSGNLFTVFNNNSSIFVFVLLRRSLLT